MTTARELLGIRSIERFAEQLRDFDKKSGGNKQGPDGAMVGKWERGERDVSAYYRSLILEFLSNHSAETFNLELSRRALLGDALGFAIFVGLDPTRLKHRPLSPEDASTNYMSFAVLLLDDLCNLHKQGVEEALDLGTERYNDLKSRAHQAFDTMQSVILPRLQLALSPEHHRDTWEAIFSLRLALKNLVENTFPMAEGRQPLPRRRSSNGNTENLHDLWHLANDRRGPAFQALRQSLGLAAP